MFFFGAVSGNVQMRNSTRFTVALRPTADEVEAAISEVAETLRDAEGAEAKQIARSTVEALIAPGTHTVCDITNAAKGREMAVMAAAHACRSFLFTSDSFRPDLPTDDAIHKILTTNETIATLTSRLEALSRESPECTAHMWSIKQRQEALLNKIKELEALQSDT